MAEWPPGGLEDDVRPRMAACAAAGRPFALATIVAADGGPRPVGSQMLVTGDAAWGFLSGGCIEADVTLHGRAVLADGVPRTLTYGRGSPFIDIRLPCGGRLEVLVERVAAGDPALASLIALTEARRPAAWGSDGVRRHCQPATQPRTWTASRIYVPDQRLVVVGSDPFAIAIAGLGARIGWESVLIAPFGPAADPPVPVRCVRGPAAAEIAALRPDPWTAIAVASHDLDMDQEALVAALGTDAGYVGVLGARRRLPDRIAGLRAAGLDEAAIGRLNAPIGLDIGGDGAWAVAVSVVAEIIQQRSASNGNHDTIRRESDAVRSA